MAWVRYLRRGGHVLGICGGYQMLGRTIADPDGIEGPPATVDGLALLDIDTVLEGEKILVETRGETVAGAVPFKGYEMHIGRTTHRPNPEGGRPLLRHGDGRFEGTTGANERVSGCYVHGLMTDDRQRRHWLQRIGAQASDFAYEPEIDTTLDLLADHLERHVDCDRLLALAREPKLTATS